MEKNQFELCATILIRLEKAGVLRQMLLIGSWCIPLYKEYFAGVRYNTTIKSRDIDFMIPHPRQSINKVDLPGLLKDLGFVVSFKWPEGYMRLEHPDLIVEFLVPERGKGTDKAVLLSTLGVNAQAVRMLDFLTLRTIGAVIKGVKVTLPHPALFAFHKLLIARKRKGADKSEKDREAGLRILNAMHDMDEGADAIFVFNMLPVIYRKKILRELLSLGEYKLRELFL